MLLIVSVLISIVFLVVNYIISDYDIFNPAFIFSGMNFACFIMCLALKQEYGIELHVNTLMVFSTGLLIFTLANGFSRVFRKHSGKMITKYEFSYIHIQKVWICLYILLEILVGYLTIKYVVTISSALFGAAGSLATHIGHYNYAIKFMTDQFVDLEISQNIVLKAGIPICEAFTYILIVVELNNYQVRKRIDKLECIAIIISILISMFTGSRSSAFRYITAAIAGRIIIIRRANGSYKRGNIKLLIRVVAIVVLVAVASLASRTFIGRSTTFDATWYRAIFPYFGSPIVNLDMALNSMGVYHSRLFGEQTFYNLYTFLGNKLRIDSWKEISLHLPFLTSNGISTGNVYTMYYMFIEDFGYIGVPVLTFFVGLYYCFSYSRLMRLYSTKPVINKNFFLYIYMFNSLVMLTFSNRFYEHFFSFSIWKMMILIWIMWYLVKHNWLSGKVRFGQYRGVRFKHNRNVIAKTRKM